PYLVRQLITYGAGLVKLTQLEQMARPPRRYPGIIPYLWFIVASMALAIPFVAARTYVSFVSAIKSLPTSSEPLWVMLFNWQPLLSFYIPDVALRIIGTQPLEYLILLLWIVFGYVLVDQF